MKLTIKPTFPVTVQASDFLSDADQKSQGYRPENPHPGITVNVTNGKMAGLNLGGDATSLRLQSALLAAVADAIEAKTESVGK